MGAKAREALYPGPPNDDDGTMSVARLDLRGTVVMLAAALIIPVPSYGGIGVAENGNFAVPFGETVGVNTHYAAGRESVNADALAQLHGAGARFLRNDLGWASIEQEAGVYDFVGTGVDDFVAAAEQNGLRILFILDYGNPLYGPAQAVVSEEGRNAFAAFAAAAAVRYGGRGHMWEIWNEPNLPQFWSDGDAGPNPEQYAQLVDAAVPALRGADPSATILAGAAFMGLPAVVPLLGGIEGGEFLARLFAAGILDRVDGITAHFYRAEAPESVAATVERIRTSMKDAGQVLPLWSGEWGYSTYDAEAPPTGINFLPAVSLDRQASYAARMLLTDYSLGLRGSVWFQDHDAPDPSPGDIEQHWGLVRGDLAPKPAYEAVAALTQLLGDSSLSAVLPLGAGEHGLVFDDGVRRVTALWPEDAAQWRLVAEEAGARVLARDGADVTPPGLQRGLQVRLHSDEGPIYLVGDVSVLPASLCAGDCTGDGTVGVDELVTAVGIALQAADPSRCSAADASGDGKTSVDELVAALGSALHGCQPEE